MRAGRAGVRDCLALGVAERTPATRTARDRSPDTRDARVSRVTATCDRDQTTNINLPGGRRGAPRQSKTISRVGL